MEVKGGRESDGREMGDRLQKPTGHWGWGQGGWGFGGERVREYLATSRSPAREMEEDLELVDPLLSFFLISSSLFPSFPLFLSPAPLFPISHSSFLEPLSFFPPQFPLFLVPTISTHHILSFSLLPNCL